MATQQVPLASLRQIRQHIRKSLTIPELEDSPCASLEKVAASVMAEPKTLGDLGNIFRLPGPTRASDLDPNLEGRWFVSSIDPGAALLQLKGLRVKPGMRLVPYLVRTPRGGVGHICAVPEGSSTTQFLESALPEGTEWHYPPFPEGSLNNTMLALEGDRSALSYVIASILRREMEEFGATGRDRQWSQHRIVSSLPKQVQWRWKGKSPQNFSPKVKVMDDGQAAVEFFSCRTAKPFALFRHFDRYDGESYLATSKDDAIAVVQD